MSPASSGRRSQAGAASLQVLSFVLSGWLVLTLLLRVLPIYLEHRVIVSVLETVVEDYNSETDRRSDIRSAMSKAWTVNAIDQAEFREVDIATNRSSLTLTLQYSASFPIVGPLEGVWSFDEVVTNR